MSDVASEKQIKIPLMEHESIPLGTRWVAGGLRFFSLLFLIPSLIGMLPVVTGALSLAPALSKNPIRIWEVFLGFSAYLFLIGIGAAMRAFATCLEINARGRGDQLAQWEMFALTSLRAIHVFFLSFASLSLIVSVYGTKEMDWKFWYHVIIGVSMSAMGLGVKVLREFLEKRFSNRRKQHAEFLVAARLLHQREDRLRGVVAAPPRQISRAGEASKSAPEN